MTAVRPPGGSAAPEQPGGASGHAAGEDTFGELYPPLSSEGGGSAQRFGTPAGAGYGTGYAGPDDLLTAGPPGGGRRNVIIAALAAFVVLVAGGGVAVWLTHRQHPGSGATAAQATPGRAQSGVAGGPSPLPASAPAATPTSAITATPTPAPAPASSGSLVTAVPGAARAPAAPQVEAFLNNYFAAINNRDYQQYRALLDHGMQRAMSEGAFTAGYRSTTDSGATITSITGRRPGRLAVAVTFASHQQPADSLTNTACTDWNITLYLRQRGSGYVIGRPPADYHAAYQAC